MMNDNNVFRQVNIFQKSSLLTFPMQIKTNPTWLEEEEEAPIEKEFLP